ncbi:MAG: hypothetical protein P4M09_10345 [Devosia sp.]|nr:hypothetical protein [Devosia sp.]
MVDLVIKAEDLRAAPQQVREWLAAQLLDNLNIAAVPSGSETRQEPTLAALTTEEAARMLELLRSDYLASQVFFELGRDAPDYALQRPAAHRIALADIVRHTRLGDLDHLAACLDSISAAFRQVHPDPSAMLFAFDQSGGLYVHESTRKSIKALWRAIVTSGGTGDALAASTVPAGPTVPLPDRLRTA